MQRRSYTAISSLIVFLSIITILVQFASYYFFASAYVFWGIACVISILCTHILLEQTLTYESIFIYSILTLFISLIVTVLTYYANEQSIIPYTAALFGIVAVNWLIPTSHCFVRNMLDYGVRLEGFQAFYRNNSLVFILFYFGIFLYGAFSAVSYPWDYPMVTESFNYIPFFSVSTLIENHIMGQPLGDIFIYLLSRILIYIPYGFYAALVLRRQSRVLRLFALLLFPLLIEVLQYFLLPVRCDIDDVIYGLIGGFLGALWFHLMNAIFRAVSGKNFLAKDSDFRYSHSSLHF